VKGDFLTEKDKDYPTGDFFQSGESGVATDFSLMWNQ